MHHLQLNEIEQDFTFMVVKQTKNILQVLKTTADIFDGRYANIKGKQIIIDGMTRSDIQAKMDEYIAGNLREIDSNDEQLDINEFNKRVKIIIFMITLIKNTKAKLHSKYATELMFKFNAVIDLFEESKKIFNDLNTLSNKT